METDKNEDEKKKKKGRVVVVEADRYCLWVGGKGYSCTFCLSAPKCGFIKGNEKIMLLLERVKPEIVALRETIIIVSELLTVDQISALKLKQY